MKSLDLFEKSLYFNIDHTHLRPDDIANESLHAISLLSMPTADVISIVYIPD